MPVFFELPEHHFAVNLGEDINPNLKTLEVKQLDTRIFEVSFQIEMKQTTKLKQYTAPDENPLNHFTEDDFSMAVLPIKAALASTLKNPDLKFTSTASGEILLNLAVKVPGSGKGNHGS